jgi:hypothetical protein
MKWVGYVARIGEMRCGYKVALRKAEGKLENLGLGGRIIFKLIFLISKTMYS